MRYREPFTVFQRKLKSGKSVWYYRTYDADGKRTTARTTGQTTKTAVKAYCRSLLKNNRLIPSKEIKFSEYSADWWMYGKCKYISSRIARGGTFSRTHADYHRTNLEKHILPYFGHMSISKISVFNIESWLLSFREKELSNTTANHNLETLRIMLNEAERLEFIPKSPIKSVKPLRRENVDKGIFTPDEVERLFNTRSFQNAWINPLAYFCSLVAACTGMRLGEIVVWRPAK